MVTSVIEMLELPNFIGDVMERNYDAINFISEYLYVKIA